MAYLVDILVSVFAILKPPIALLIALTSLIAILLAASSTFVRTVQANTPSLCDYSALARLARPLCDMPEVSRPQVFVAHADFPALVNVQSIVFDQLMDTPASGAELSLSVRHAELAIRDLVALVLASNLTVKDLLATALTDVAIDARSTGRKLQRLSIQINGMFDR